MSSEKTLQQPQQPQETQKQRGSDIDTAVCAPKPENEKEKTYTCYSSAALDKIKRLWNARHPDQKIAETDPRSVWKQLKHKLRSVCSNEACWLRQSFIKNGLDKETLQYTFAPEAPQSWKKNPTEWLSSIDIVAVMKQYEHAYPSFDFMGPSPIDYDTELDYGEHVWQELYEFDLKKQLHSGKTKLGVIFNTDPHDQSGAHWISLFMDTTKKFIFFFDSTGDSMPTEVSRFINTLKKQGEEEGIQFKVFSNKLRHQKKDTECGVYSIFMITHLLSGKMTPADFDDERLADDYMQTFRSQYFML